MQISTGFRSYQTYSTELLSSQNSSSEEAAGEKARWFVENYPELTQLSDEFIDSQSRHLCLWQGPEGLLATVYDPHSHTFKILSGSQVRNGFNPHEPPHILQARLVSSRSVQWDLVLRDHTLYVWPHLRAAAWEDFIPTDGTVNKPRTAFEGTHTLMEAMVVLYKEGFRTTEDARICIQQEYEDDDGEIKTFVTDLKTTQIKEIQQYLNDKDLNGKITAISLYDRHGNPKAGIEFRHPQDTSQTCFHADFSEHVAHIDVRVGVGTKISQAEKKVNFQEFGGKNLNPKEFALFIKNGGRYPDPDGPPGGNSGSKGGGGGSGGNAGSSGNNGGSGGNTRLSGSSAKSGAGCGSTGAFQNNLNQNNLIDSYNRTNPNQPLIKTSHQTDIGGVAIANPNAILLNLNNSLYDLTADGYWLAFPFLTDTAKPFSNKQLQQIIRELAQTIYIHNTFPFYSLHFTQTGTLYSVIHPAYQNTLVGKVIGMIDYFMKGYLNGGYFKESDLMRFAGDPAWIKDIDQLKPSIQSMETLYQETFQDGSEYRSLAQLLEQYCIKQYHWKLDKTAVEKIQQRFQISFRIIAKQDQIEKHDSTLLFHGGMDVLYTIECHRGAIDQREQYEKSEEYQWLERFCDYVANDIKTRLPQLKPCQQYFKMLDVICALSYYFSSLKRQEMTPRILPVEADTAQTCLGRFPPYPKTQLECEKNSVTLWEVIQTLDPESTRLLDEFLLQKVSHIAPSLQTALAQAIQKLLPKEVLKFTAGYLDEMVLPLVKSTLEGILKLKEQVFDEQQREIEAAQGKAKKNIQDHEAMRVSLREQHDARHKQIGYQEREEIASQRRVLEQTRDEQLQKIEQVSIPFIPPFAGVDFEGENYKFWQKSSLQAAMRTRLDQKFNDTLWELTDDIKAHWRKRSQAVCTAYRQAIQELDEHLGKVRSVLKTIQAELAKIDTMRLSVNTHPSQQAIAELIQLTIPILVGKLTPSFSTEYTPLVRIHGGTGFRLEDHALLLNTALSMGLSQRLEADAVRPSKKGSRERWKAVTINDQSYQAFYIQHASALDPSALEQSLIKPNMASTDGEKRWIQLVSQPSTATPLHAVTECLTSNKQTLTITDAYGNTALHLAAMNDNLALTTLLLEQGIKIDALNQFGNSALHVASMYGHKQIIQAIYQAYPNSLRQLTMNDESVLHLAVLHHRLETVKLLVSMGLDLNEIGINGIPLIYTALYHHAFEITDYLLSNSRIDVGFQLENGNTLLHLAVRLNDSATVQTLLKKKIDTTLYNREGKTPLHCAVELGSLGSVQQLLNHDKSALEYADSAGYTPLYLAIVHRQESVMDDLLKLGAKTDPIIEGGNALTHALRTGQVRVAQALLNAYPFTLNAPQPIDKENFLWMCKLGLWSLCEQIITHDPQWVTRRLGPNHAELNCYIDYLFKYNRTVQWWQLPESCEKSTTAYLKKHADKLYQLGFKHGSSAMLLQLQSILDDGQLDPDAKRFQNARFAAYRDDDMIQLAVRVGLPQFYEPYLAHAPDPAALERPTLDGKNLLYLAAERGDRALIETLLDKGASPIAPNGHHFFYALVAHHHPDILRSLLLDARYRSSLNINGVVSEKEKLRAIDLACQQGNLKMAIHLIQCGAKMNEPNQQNKLPIHYAIENNAPHLIRLIFKYEIGELGDILNEAIRLHKQAIFRQLLDHRPGYKKAVLCAADRLLVTAIDHHNVEAYKLLTGLGAPVDASLLHRAIKCNAHEIVPLLMAAGCDSQAEENGRTPLELACELNYDLCAHALIQGGLFDPALRVTPSKWIALVLAGKTAAINQTIVEAIQQDDLGQVKELMTRYAPGNLQYPYKGEVINGSVLDIAILENKPALIQYLFDENVCDPYRLNALDLSAVHLLMKLSDAEFVVQLIEKFKLDIHRVDPKNGCLPLHMALLAKNQAMTDYLMANGADKYAEMVEGKTLLHLAIEQKDLGFTQRAIEHYGYALHHKNSRQESALAIALKTGNIEIARYLIEAGADIHGRDGFKQRTMLHYAVLSHDAKVVFYLLSCGVQSNLPDNIGMLPIHLAAKQGDREIVDLLDDFEEREEGEGRQGTVVTRMDRRERDVRDFAFIHRHPALSAHLTQKHGLPLRDTLTSHQPIDFKTYRQGGKTPLELAILAEDQTTVVTLIDQVAADDTFHIKRALAAASASQNVTLFNYVINRLWDGKNQQLLQTCLAAAIVNNSTENVKQLLNMLGENRKNLIFEGGATPIVFACVAQAHDVLKELLTHINPPSHEIYAAFKPLIQHDQLVMAKLLYAYDPAAIHLTGSHGETLLHHAVNHNRPNMVAFLILCGCVDKENYAGKSALSLAMQANQTESIKYLTTAYPHGVAAGQNLIQYLARKEPVDYPTLNWLCRFQDVNARDSAGHTALHVAIEQRDVKAVEILLSHEADVSLTNQHNQDALVLAAADPLILAAIALSFPEMIPQMIPHIDLPHVMGDIWNRHENNRISIIKALLASVDKDHHYLYELLAHAVDAGSEANAQQCVIMYQQLYPDAPSLLESAYQAYCAYRQQKDPEQASHVQTFSWLLAHHSNPYTTFNSKLADIKTEAKIGEIYQNWYDKQWEILTQRLDHQLHFKGIECVLGMLKKLMPEIESCAQAKTYDDASWVQLFLFLDGVITTGVKDVAPGTLINEMENVATPTGLVMIRQALAQPYLRDLIKRQASQQEHVSTINRAPLRRSLLFPNRFLHQASQQEEHVSTINRAPLRRSLLFPTRFLHQASQQEEHASTINRAPLRRSFLDPMFLRDHDV